MKKRTTKRYPVIHPKTAVKRFFQCNWRIVLFCCVLAAAITYGVYLSSHLGEEQNERLVSLVKEQLDQNKNLGFWPLFKNSFCSHLLYLSALFLLGLCAIGTPFVFAVPVLKGLGVGMFCGYIYNAYHMKGVGYVSLMIAPAVILFLTIMIYCCQESFCMSLEIFVCTNRISEGKTRTGTTVPVYCKRYLIFLFGMFLVALLDAALKSVLSTLLIL